MPTANPSIVPSFRARSGQWLLAALVVFSIAGGPPAVASTIYVDVNYAGCPGSGTQGDPFCKIQDGIDAAQSGDTVLVAPGTYVENIDFLGKDITLRSTHGAEQTIIDGNNQATVVVFENGEGSGAVLEGFTVFFGGGVPTPFGGGIRCDGTSPVIRHNVIRGSFARYGGGLFCTNGAAPQIRENVIRDNYSYNAGGGIACELGSAPVIEGNVIARNDADEGGGVHCSTSADVTLTNNRIVANSSSASDSSTEGGGLFFSSASGTLIGNLIARNVAENQGSAAGGGLTIRASSLRMVNNTIAYNLAEPGGFGSFGGGFDSIDSQVDITNGILWGNAANSDGNFRIIRGSVTMSHTDVEGGYPGTGNIDADPLFLDTSGDGFRLACNSPCLEAGTNTPSGVTLPSTDLEGDDRIVDADSLGSSIVDMGSDEFDVLWQINGPAKPNTSIQFTSQVPPLVGGDLAFLFISGGDGTSSGGIPIPIPGSNGRRLMLDPDPIFDFGLRLPSALRRVTAMGCPGASTASATLPSSVPTGLQVFYAGFTVDGFGQLGSVTPTHSFVIQP